MPAALQAVQRSMARQGSAKGLRSAQSYSVQNQPSSSLVAEIFAALGPLGEYL